MLGRGSGVLFGALKRVTGIDLLRDLSEFFRSFGDMVEGFRERADAVNELLGDERSTFVLVTSPREDAIDEAIFFHERLREAGLPFAGVIVNRVRMPVPAHDADVADEVEALLGDALARKVVRTWDEERVLAARDRAALRRLGSGSTGHADRGAAARRGRARPRRPGAAERLPVQTGAE